MVVRIAGLAYQKGFGGHFHNDNSLGALREIPGLALACPSRGDDAVRMLRGALAMASTSGRVVAFLEPIALYHERDLHEPGDGGWLRDIPSSTAGRSNRSSRVRGIEHLDHGDLLIVSYANGFRSRCAPRPPRGAGPPGRTPPAPLGCHPPRGRVAQLVVDECRATGAASPTPS